MKLVVTQYDLRYLFSALDMVSCNRQTNKQTNKPKKVPSGTHRG